MEEGHALTGTSRRVSIPILRPMEAEGEVRRRGGNASQAAPGFRCAGGALCLLPVW